MRPASARDVMVVAAARALRSEDVCFVGIGLPSLACNLARHMHAPGITLVYESGTIGAKPGKLPLSIGDDELCETSLTTVGTVEMFRYWLQGGRITVGFLGGAQIDRHANLNTTVIGDYLHPSVRLPGGGGAPEIATDSKRVFIVMNMSRRSFVPELPFVTSLGHRVGARGRRDYGVPTGGPAKVFTDLCVLEPEPETGELEVVALHPSVTMEQVRDACGWDMRFRAGHGRTEAPSAEEIDVLRWLRANAA